MSTAHLTGLLTALSEARISPMDRGFLFGDGVYEVICRWTGLRQIPCYGSKLVAMPYHLERLNHYLNGIR